VIPDWWSFTLLALAAFRVWKLLADDVIFDRVRERVLGIYETRPALARGFFGFISCGWCLGFWTSLAWWLGWLAWPTGVLVFATPWALSTVVGFLVEALPDSDSA